MGEALREIDFGIHFFLSPSFVPLTIACWAAIRSVLPYLSPGILMSARKFGVMTVLRANESGDIKRQVAKGGLGWSVWSVLPLRHVCLSCWSVLLFPGLSLPVAVTFKTSPGPCVPDGCALCMKRGL